MKRCDEVCTLHPRSKEKVAAAESDPFVGALAFRFGADSVRLRHVAEYGRPR